MRHSHLCTTLLLCFSALSSAQTVAPSNSSQDVPPPADGPRFWVNATDIGFIVAPLSFYAQMPHDQFLSIDMSAPILNVGTSNANSLSGSTFSYISCDPQDYSGNIDANDVVQIVATSQQQSTAIILYSTRSNHCSADNLKSIPYVNGIFTTLDPTLAASVQSKLAADKNPPTATLLPDKSSDTNNSNNGSGWGGGTPSGTTAVAMIVLYTITGIITALFVIIIITGAVRAHRHPERYGPRNIAGRPRQSRAKGIARAMLETLPIVKFGDQNDLEKNKTESEIEMQGNSTATSAADQPTERAAEQTAENTTTSESKQTDPIATTTAASTAAANPDGTDASGHLGCSICTEDFNKGEEVRVLPCNHKFHPECVDPWLLNVSGTCPLCRIDLRPAEEQQKNAQSGQSSDAAAAASQTVGSPSNRRVSILDASFAPPLGPLPSRLSRHSITTRRDTMYNLRQTASGTREERIAALRRFRQQRRNRNSTTEGDVQDEEEERGLTTRLRDRFRIRTRTQGEEPTSTSTFQPESSSAQRTAQTEQRSSVTAPAPTWTT